MLARLLLVVSLAILGFVAGASLGNRWSPEGASGIVSAALAGLGLGLVLGLLGAWQMSPRRRRLVLALTAPLAFAVMGWLAWNVSELRKPAEDPEIAYLGLPSYHLALTGLDGSEGATSVVIDTAARRWETRHTDGRVCRGLLRASVQERVGLSLIAALPVPEGAEDACLSDAPGARIEWRLETGEEPETGAATITQECRVAHPALDGLARTLTLAPTLAQSRPLCS